MLKCKLAAFSNNYFKKNLKKVEKSLDFLIVHTYTVSRDDES